METSAIFVANVPADIAQQIARIARVVLADRAHTPGIHTHVLYVVLNVGWNNLDMVKILRHQSAGNTVTVLVRNVGVGAYDESEYANFGCNVIGPFQTDQVSKVIVVSPVVRKRLDAAVDAAARLRPVYFVGANSFEGSDNNAKAFADFLQFPVVKPAARQSLLGQTVVFYARAFLTSSGLLANVSRENKDSVLMYLSRGARVLVVEHIEKHETDAQRYRPLDIPNRSGQYNGVVALSVQQDTALDGKPSPIEAGPGARDLVMAFLLSG